MAERTQLLLGGREGGTEEPPTPADKPQECVGSAAWSTHFMLLLNCLVASKLRYSIMKTLLYVGHTTC